MSIPYPLSIPYWGYYLFTASLVVGVQEFGQGIFNFRLLIEIFSTFEIISKMLKISR